MTEVITTSPEASSNDETVEDKDKTTKIAVTAAEADAAISPLKEHMSRIRGGDLRLDLVIRQLESGSPDISVTAEQAGMVATVLEIHPHRQIYRAEYVQLMDSLARKFREVH